MARNRRPLATFNLAFIDAMACGLGAVILLFMIIHHATEVRAAEQNRNIAEQVSAIEDEVLEKRQAEAELAAALEATERQLRAARARAASLEESLAQDTETAPEDDAQLASLKEEVRRLQRQVETLRAEQEDEGDALRERAGEGRQQYLSGLEVTGRHILILVDASASMLEESVVGVIRRRNMRESEQRAAPKWRWTLDAVDWLTTQLPASVNFQLYTFNTVAESVISGSTGQWHSTAGGRRVNEAMRELRQVLPAGGTSLHRAFSAAAALSPRPDHIYLITDGLPTQGERSRSGTVSGNQRLDLFGRAVRQLPRGAAVHTLLFPMEGDPQAAGAYWQLAQGSGGSFLTPSRDWP